MKKLNFGDLPNDKNIHEKLQNFHDSVEKIEKILNIALKANVESMSLKEKIDFDLFITYCLNTLYWMYLRSRGEDPNKNDVKNQLTRVKEYMMKGKQAHERQTIRPRIDQQVAERFVKHGISYKKSKDNPTPNKKIKFDD